MPVYILTGTILPSSGGKGSRKKTFRDDRRIGREEKGVRKRGKRQKKGLEEKELEERREGRREKKRLERVTGKNN